MSQSVKDEEFTKILKDSDRKEFDEKIKEFVNLQEQEKMHQQDLLKILEPRNKRIDACVKSCATQHKQAYQAFQDVKKKSTKEYLTKTSSFKNFTKEEFDS